MIAKEIWTKFKVHAKAHGYYKKVVGDYAYLNNRNKIMRLKGFKPGIGISIWEAGETYFI